MRTMTILTALTGLLAAACASGPADGSGASVVEDTAAEDTEVEDTDSGADDELAADDSADGDDDGAAATADGDEAGDDAALGTRDNPVEVGTRIEMGEWDLAVTEVQLDATDAVLAENEFNDPPVDGRQFVLIAVDASYEGDDSGTAWLDFSWAVVGSQGNTFGTGTDDYCGVIPDSLDDTGETFPGGTVSGNVCVSVESDQVEGGTIRIEEAFSFDDTRAFYVLD